MTVSNITVPVAANLSKSFHNLPTARVRELLAILDAKTIVIEGLDRDLNLMAQHSTDFQAELRKSKSYAESLKDELMAEQENSAALQEKLEEFYRREAGTKSLLDRQLAILNRSGKMGDRIEETKFLTRSFLKDFKEYQPEVEFDFSGLKVLVVDDSKTILRTAENFLSEYDCWVVTASDGIEGVEVAGSFVPDIIFMDISMPKMDGYEAIFEIMKDSRMDAIPIVFITSIDRDKIKSEFSDIPYVGKPFTRNDLLDAIKQNCK